MLVSLAFWCDIMCMCQASTNLCSFSMLLVMRRTHDIVMIADDDDGATIGLYDILSTF